ncbi:iron ABC transporter permease [Corynebacterium sp. TAE3-ERU12]|uniref:FecCD family ABC transporter permease n=1 Tax=Corynebacterium sp. TAE3-ERU12 TaxID=2849491 RepID=UPI001C46D01A|nr:iron ABC transporter permease [Corynebacterium sp. TAE3-ERU12]MBV7294639.1 iron ABC transporter permease [Corynebacterium sp. TAE3-ERU12]
MTATTLSAPRTASGRRSRRLVGLITLLVTTLIVACASMLYGARDIAVTDSVSYIPDVWAAITGAVPLESQNPDVRVLAGLRFPRTLVGLVVGSALGVAGGLIQGHTRNPLADPGIIGISAGAALAVVVGFAFFGVVAPLATALSAFAGAIAATVLVFGLTSVGSGQSNPLMLIIAGAALTAVLSACTTALVLTSEANLDRMRFWTVGSLAGRDLSVFWAALPIALVGLVAAFATAPILNALNLGDDVAAGLGINVTRARLMGMGLIALLAGSATAAAGPIGFVGLVVPHLVRPYSGPDHRWLLPYAALAGAILTLGADVVGRLILPSGELQVGIVLAVVGAPFFLYLLQRDKVVRL